MRRFSQRSALVTLSEINITPLLDLAFVLLIIFVITTPLLEQSIPLTLPKGGTPLKPLPKEDIRTVEITPQGAYSLDRKPMNLAQIETQLVKDFKANPNLVVYIRADENGKNKDLYAVVNVCQRNNMTRFSLQTEPPGTTRRR
jgi:biopolymer transport protein ExbD